MVQPVDVADFDELTLLDETIGRIRSRIATCDESEFSALGALLLKYLQRRGELSAVPTEPTAKPGSIAAVTSRLEIVGQAKK